MEEGAKSLKSKPRCHGCGCCCFLCQRIQIVDLVQDNVRFRGMTLSLFLFIVLSVLYFFFTATDSTVEKVAVALLAIFVAPMISVNSPQSNLPTVIFSCGLTIESIWGLGVIALSIELAYDEAYSALICSFQNIGPLYDIIQGITLPTNGTQAQTRNISTDNSIDVSCVPFVGFVWGISGIILGIYFCLPLLFTRIKALTHRQHYLQKQASYFLHVKNLVLDPVRHSKKKEFELTKSQKWFSDGKLEIESEKPLLGKPKPSLLEKLKQILGFNKPNLHERFEGSDVFFFPQRIILSVVPALVVAAIVTGLLVQVVLSISLSIIVFVVALFPALNLQGVAAQEILDTIKHAASTEIALIILSGICTFVIILVLLLLMMRSFRREVMLARQGKSRIDKSKVNIYDSTNFVSSLLGNTFVASIIYFIVLFLIFNFFLFLHLIPGMLEAIWNFFVKVALTPVLLAVVQIGVVMILKVVMVSDNLINHPVIFSYLDLIHLFYNSALAIVTGIVSYIKNAFKAFLIDFLMLNSANQYFGAIVVMENTYSNPIVHVFIEILKEKLEHKASGLSQKELKRKRIRELLWLWVFMSKNPELRFHRKQFLDTKKLSSEYL